MKIRISLFAMIVFCGIKLAASFGSLEAIHYLDGIDHLVVVDINSTNNEHRFTVDGVEISCGFKSEARIVEQLKGNYSRRNIVFASANPMKVSTRYLLALSNSKQDFPSDVSHIIGDPDTYNKKHKRCLKNLPLLKENWLFSSEFVRNGWVIGGYKVLVPFDKVKGVTYEVKQVEINKVVRPLYEHKDRDALPYEVTLPGYLLEWKSYKKYLLEQVDKVNTREWIELKELERKKYLDELDES